MIRNIEGFNNYHATLCGKIISLKNNRNQDVVKILKPSKTVAGYHKYILTNNFNKKTFLGHRIVIKAFKENVENKPDVNHKDGDKSNNCISNLEWCTKSENMKHALKTELLIPNSKGKHYKAKQILDLETGIFYDSNIEYCEAKGLQKFRLKNMNKRKHIKRNYTIL